MTQEEIRGRVQVLGPWFHNMELGGVRTAPDHFLGDYPGMKWRHLQPNLPDVRGRTVLDVGCNAGFYAIQCRKLGAASVLGIDEDPRYLAQARLAAEIEEVDIAWERMSVYDVAQLGRTFDVVLFMGVLYHLRHPLLALDLLRDHVAADWLVFQSLLRGSGKVADVAADYGFHETEIFHDPGFPKLHFVEHHYAEDGTNWWIPNRACAEAMLRSSGFRICRELPGEIYLCRAAEIPAGARRG